MTETATGWREQPDSLGKTRRTRETPRPPVPRKFLNELRDSVRSLCGSASQLHAASGRLRLLERPGPPSRYLHEHSLGTNSRLARITKGRMTVRELYARRVIKQHFPLENLVFTLIAKASEIAPLAKKYATDIQTKSVTAPGF